MTRSSFLIGLVALAVIALGVASYLVFAGSSTNDLLAADSDVSVAVNAGDMTMGDPKAPITMLEYAAPTCPVCARFNHDSFPVIKRDYIDTGKVFYIFRVFPLQQVDLAAEALLRCAPKDQYFQFLDTLFRNQDKWDPDGYQIPDVHGALIQMARIVGLDATKADRCMADQAQLNRASKVGTDAETQYGVQGTPTFIINGQKRVGPYDPATWKSYLDSLLAKK